ncbi:hypothetical protein D3C85_1515410 [compost metagenome]
MGRLGEETVNVIAKGQFQAKRHAARTTAHAAREIDIQRMIRIHHAPLLGKLRFQALTCNGIT